MTTGAGRTLTWNADNRLASVTAADNTTMTFSYDADGVRLQQIEVATAHTYLGDDYEVTLPGAVAKYVTLAGTLVARKDGTTTYWVHTDHVGSIQAETDSSGNEVHRKKYRPFGEILSTGGTLVYEPCGFTGQRRDASGLVYLHARYYDPTLGRFISPDPTIPGTDNIGLNRYAYAANDPIDRTDVDGLDHTKKGRRMALRRGHRPVALALAPALWSRPLVVWWGGHSLGRPFRVQGSLTKTEGLSGH
jgi:RHS repeat-associated protein